MRKLPTAIAVIALIATPAFAADIAVKAPPPAPAPVYNWTGWYVGVNAGASFGNVKTDFNVATITETNATEIVPPAITAPFAGSDRQYPDGFIGGGQAGYNWQLSPIWVVGLEADFQGALERDSNSVTNPIAFTVLSVVTGSGTMVTDYATKIDWFGTVRGRIGYVWGDGQVLSYVTGGLAYGKVDIEGTNTVTNPVLGSNGLAVAFGHSQVNAGWTVGFGTEGALAGMPGWTWKVESLYMDLGHLDATGPGVSFTFGTQPPFTFNVTGGGVTAHSHFTDGILRGGLNYKFY